MLFLKLVALAVTSAIMILVPYHASTWLCGLSGDQAILVTWAWIFLFMCVIIFTGDDR